MTTDPGDLIFDPTSGSGTTAYVAEQWGRRWITCETSGVALARARRRLMTATFNYYALADPGEGVAAGFIYETVPHLTLRSIAQNRDLDPDKLRGKSRREIQGILRKSADQEQRYDQPKIDRNKVRVSGPFTVETIPVPALDDPSQSPIPRPEVGAREAAARARA